MRMPETLEIEFIDVYSPEGEGPINQWIDAVLGGLDPESDDSIYHWVHIRDAEVAKRILVENEITGNFQLF